MTTRQIVAVVSLIIVATTFVFLLPDSVEEQKSDANTNSQARPERKTSQRAESTGEEPESLAGTSEESCNRECNRAVEFAQSIYNFDLDYQQRAQAAAEAYVAPWGTDAVLRWRPLYVDPKSILLTSHLQPGAMPERLVISPFDDLIFEAVRTEYLIFEKIESAQWHGKLVGAHSGRVSLGIVGGETNPGFVLKIIVGPDEQPMVYSIIPTMESDVYVAVEGNPHQTINHSH